jgi:predicted membrane channel-forming protein YqfA (hemolysin III family)
MRRLAPACHSRPEFAPKRTYLKSPCGQATQVKQPYSAMHIVAIAWMFVVLLFALAEATAPQGSVLGAAMTLVFYGLLPLGLILYVMATPMRRRARARREASALAADPDRGGHAAGAAVAPEREEP